MDIWKRNCPEQLKLFKLTTGCKFLDEALKGGILSHGITEISGESASGKTQLCLQLCLNVQLPLSHGGLNGGKFGGLWHFYWLTVPSVVS